MVVRAATPSNVIRITSRVGIPRAELRFRFSRSAGPGGQNVNKVNTRVTLLFALDSSSALNDFQRRVIRRRLETRIAQDGVLRVVSSRFRTQAANRRAAVERFAELLAGALTPVKQRKQTAVPRSARERRLQEKSRRAQTKRGRSGVSAADE